jgi:hypothetical protein
MLYRVQLAMNGDELTTLVMIGTDCTGSCKSNYHTIMTTTAPRFFMRLIINGQISIIKIKYTYYSYFICYINIHNSKIITNGTPEPESLNWLFM